MVGVSNAVLNETAGSVSYAARKCNECPVGQPCDKGVSFRGTDTFEGSGKKKSGSLLKTVALLIGLGAVSVAGMGYAHNKGVFNTLKSKVKKDSYKTILEKVDDAAKTCKGWCDTALEKAEGLRIRIKDFFNKKQG